MSDADDLLHAVTTRRHELAQAIRHIKEQLTHDFENGNLTENGGAVLFDAAMLLVALARLVEHGMIPRAFGAPGDWGYDTPIGGALVKLYKAMNEGKAREPHATPDMHKSFAELKDRYARAVLWMLDHEDDSDKWPDWMAGCRTIIEDADAAYAGTSKLSESAE